MLFLSDTSLEFQLQRDTFVENKINLSIIIFIKFKKTRVNTVASQSIHTYDNTHIISADGLCAWWKKLCTMWAASSEDLEIRNLDLGLLAQQVELSRPASLRSAEMRAWQQSRFTFHWALVDNNGYLGRKKHWLEWEARSAQTALGLGTNPSQIKC